MIALGVVVGAVFAKKWLTPGDVYVPEARGSDPETS